MDTEDIEAFLAVVRFGSLTEAANSLFISQSTLSHRLAELEREVGMSLIDRGRGIRSLALTDYGKEFLLLAKRWEQLVQDTRRIKTRTQKLTLSIGAVDTIHTFVLTSLYQSLHEYTENISFRIRTHNSTELYLKVDQGEIDIAFSLLDLPMKNITVQKFYIEPRVVLRKELLSAGRSNEYITPGDLDFSREVFFEGDPAFHTWYLRWKDGKGYPSLQVDTAQLLIPLLDMEGAWSIAPLCIAKKLVSMDSFSYYYLEDHPPERTCYRIQSQNPKTSIRDFLQILDSHLNLLSMELMLGIKE